MSAGLFQSESQIASAAIGHPGTEVSPRVEAVARAICEAERMNPDDALGGWRHWIDAANAALLVMKRPRAATHANTMRGPHPLAAQVCLLRDRHFSFGEIAAQLGCSRNVVAGICHRMVERKA